VDISGPYDDLILWVAALLTIYVVWDRWKATDGDLWFGHRRNATQGQNERPTPTAQSGTTDPPNSP